jgi:hypothetical protein
VEREGSRWRGRGVGGEGIQAMHSYLCGAACNALIFMWCSLQCTHIYVLQPGALFGDLALNSDGAASEA